MSQRTTGSSMKRRSSRWAKARTLTRCQRRRYPAHPRRRGPRYGQMLLGNESKERDEANFREAVQSATVFAKIPPTQKGSKFESMFSLLGASAWLPLLIMQPVQLLVQNRPLSAPSLLHCYPMERRRRAASVLLVPETRAIMAATAILVRPICLEG